MNAMQTPTVRRHPIRGFFWGLLAGFGLAFLLVGLAVIALGTLTPWFVALGVALLGVVWGLVGPAKGAGPPAGGPTPVPPAAGTPPAPPPPPPAPPAGAAGI